MEESIKEVNDVTQIPKTVLRLLLNHFKWDQQKLMEKYFSNDQEAMFTEAKVPSPNKRTILKGTSSKFSKKQRIVKDPECQICYLSISNDVSDYLLCNSPNIAVLSAVTSTKKYIFIRNYCYINSITILKFFIS